MDKKEKDRKKLVRELNGKLNEVNNVGSIEDLVKDNKIEFESEKITYRVRKPNYRENQEVRKQQDMKKIELLENPKYKLRKELIKIYKQNGIDIEEMERKIASFPKRLEPIQEKLAIARFPRERDPLIEEIEKLEEKQLELIIERNEYLDSCIENRIIEHANLYMLYLVLEKKIDEKWIKAFDNYETFLENDDIIIKGSNFLSLLIYNKTIANNE